jgi:hypothetical protein
MGKYRLWLHHQEVGRRLREQIATYEQERERVQRMAPSHPTTLPDTSNPLVRALLDFTGRGGALGRAPGSRISGTPATGSDADPQPARPAELNLGMAAGTGPSGSTPTAPLSPTGRPQSPQASAAPAANDPIAAQLAARAAQMPADPLEAMRTLAQSQGRDPQGPPQPPATGPGSSGPGQAAPNAPATPEGNTAGEWWQRFRTQS